MADEDRETWIRENLLIQAMTPHGRTVTAEDLAHEWDGLYARHPEAFRKSLARTATASRHMLERNVTDSRAA